MPHMQSDIGIAAALPRHAINIQVARQRYALYRGAQQLPVDARIAQQLSAVHTQRRGSLQHRLQARCGNTAVASDGHAV